MSANEIDQILESTPIPTGEEPVAVPTSLRTIAKKIGKEYLELVDECITFYQHHDELSLSLPRDRGVYVEKVEKHGSLYMIHFLTENFLSSLEAVKDHNRDYFAYQSDKVAKGKGKMEKVKMTYFIGKTTMKRVVQDAGSDLLFKIFHFFTRSFESLTTKESSGEDPITFREDYVKYVSDHFDDNKNYAKMQLVMDNVDAILEDYDADAIREGNAAAAACEEGACGGGKKKKKKKGKKSSSGGEGGEFDPFSMFGAGMGDQMGKGLLNSFETTKIGQLAKNISGKMRPEDFPMLSDPSQLLASLTNPNAEGGGSIGDLIKFVMEEVQTTLKEENINETDLISEAQGMMGGLSKMTGINPEEMVRSMASAVPSTGSASTATEGEARPPMPMPDFSQFAGIFENLGKELQKGLQDAEKVKGKKSRE
jgi:hypothetical protein